MVALPKDSIPSPGIISCVSESDILKSLTPEEMFQIFEQKFKKTSQRELLAVLPEENLHFLEMYRNFDYYIAKGSEEELGMCKALSDFIIDNPIDPSIMFLLRKDGPSGLEVIGVCKNEKLAQKLCSKFSTPNSSVIYKETQVLAENLAE